MARKKFGESGPMDEWSEKMRTILEEMGRRKLCDFRPSGAWRPAINLYDCRSAYFLCIDLAGVDSDGLLVRIEAARRITISGNRAQPRLVVEEGPLSIEVLEIDEGPFEREVDLPTPVDEARIEIRHDKGYVWITLRKINPS